MHLCSTVTIVLQAEAEQDLEIANSVITPAVKASRKRAQNTSYRAQNKMARLCQDASCEKEKVEAEWERMRVQMRNLIGEVSAHREDVDRKAKEMRAEWEALEESRRAEEDKLRLAELELQQQLTTRTCEYEGSRKEFNV